MNKKGFTLIELLAVIVILAIIALIATPIVLNIINDSRKSSFESTVDSVKRAVELKISKEQLDGIAEYPYALDIQDLDLKNKENLNGKIIINSKDDIVINLNDGNYYYYGEEILNNKPYIKTKVVDGKGKNIVIDEQRKYIYGFDESWIDLDTFEPLKYFEAVNGAVEIENNEQGTYSTGAKVILKNNDGNIVNEYYIIIFGDVDGDSAAGFSDSGICVDIRENKNNISYGHYQIYAVKNINDCAWLFDFEMLGEYEINQFTRKLEQVDLSKYE